MKLKKIASLMLAGVMAVSMLAGCSNGTKPDDGEKDPVVDSSLTGKVIAALDEDTTKNVEFKADSNLESVLKKVVSNIGYDGVKNGSFDWKTLTAIDPDLGTSNQLANVGEGGGSEDTDKKESVAVFAEHVSGVGKNAATVAKELAKKIDDRSNVGKLNTVTDISWDKLPAYSADYIDKDGDSYWYDFDYTAGVAVVEVSDASTGETEYLVAVTVTRTPTQTYKHA